MDPGALHELLALGGEEGCEGLVDFGDLAHGADEAVVVFVEAEKLFDWPCAGLFFGVFVQPVQEDLYDVLYYIF